MLTFSRVLQGDDADRPELLSSAEGFELLTKNVAGPLCATTVAEMGAVDG